jgi:hypothetical protein
VKIVLFEIPAFGLFNFLIEITHSLNYNVKGRDRIEKNKSRRAINKKNYSFYLTYRPLPYK